MRDYHYSFRISFTIVQNSRFSRVKLQGRGARSHIVNTITTHYNICSIRVPRGYYRRVERLGRNRKQEVSWLRTGEKIRHRRSDTCDDTTTSAFRLFAGRVCSPQNTTTRTNEREKETRVNGLKKLERKKNAIV